jgi:hypothetical protein
MKAKLERLILSEIPDLISFLMVSAATREKRSGQ